MLKLIHESVDLEKQNEMGQLAGQEGDAFSISKKKSRLI